MSEAKVLNLSNNHYSQLSKLLDVARSMGEKRNLDDLLHYILSQGSIALSCERTSIFLVDKEKGEIWSRLALGEGDIIRFQEGKGIAGSTINDDKIIVLEDAYSDARFNDEVDRVTGFKTKAIASIPMRNNRGETIGCLQAINKLGSSTFTEADCEFALAFASQAAVAIESAQLHEQNTKIIHELTVAKNDLNEKIDQIQMIHAVEKSAHESDSLSKFLEEFTGRVCESLSTSGCSILLEWEQGKWLYYIYTLNEGCREIPLPFTPELEELFAKTEDSGNHYAPDKYDFSSLDYHHKLEVLVRASLAFDFKKITQQGESVHRRGVLQVIHDQNIDFIKENSAVLEILSGNLAAIVEKKLLQETQEQSNRLATIGELSGTIFHDFKNPMASIRGIAELIQINRDNMTVAKLEKFTGIIQKQVDRCVGMIDELLSFTRGETNLNLRQGTLKTFLTEISEMLQVETDRSGIKLKVDVKKDISFKFDDAKLMRVIFNLTNNALEVLDEGDGIDIEGWVRDDGFVMISVSDSGPGVPSHLHDSLFEVFVTHGKKNGTGLGLNISRQVVTAHGGKIELDSSYKDGARFLVSLDPDPKIAA